MSLYRGSIRRYMSIGLSILVLGACGGPDDPYKDIRIKKSDSPKTAFEKRVKYLERKILEHSEFEIAKRKYDIKKWGESLRADFKNPLVRLSTGECFDLSKIPDPWFISQVYVDLTRVSTSPFLKSQTEYQAIDYFDIDVRMRDLQLPFVDIVKRDIWLDRLQEYMYVRVTSKPALRFRWERGIREKSFVYYQSKIDESGWKPVELSALEFGNWKFDWYTFQTRMESTVTVLADFSKQAILIGSSWNVETQSLLNHTEEGYPLVPENQLLIPLAGLYPASDGGRHQRRGFKRYDYGHPSVSFGKRVYDTGYGYQIMFSALSTPHTAEIFSKVDAVMKKVKTECE